MRSVHNSIMTQRALVRDGIGWGLEGQPGLYDSYPGVESASPFPRDRITLAEGVRAEQTNEPRDWPECFSRLSRTLCSRFSMSSLVGWLASVQIPV